MIKIQMALGNFRIFSEKVPCHVIRTNCKLKLLSIYYLNLALQYFFRQRQFSLLSTLKILCANLSIMPKANYNYYLITRTDDSRSGMSDVVTQRFTLQCETLHSVLVCTTWTRTHELGGE